MFKTDKENSVNKKIIRKKRSKEKTKPDILPTTYTSTCRCSKCKNKITILRKRTELAKIGIIKEISKSERFPKSLNKLNTLNQKEWDMFLPVLRLWLRDSRTIPDKNISFEDIKKNIKSLYKN